MTIKLTNSAAIELENEYAEALAEKKRDEIEYLEFAKDPARKERPYYSLTEIRESIEILGLKHAEAKKLADAERAKLPSAETARKIIAETAKALAGKQAVQHEAAIKARTAIEQLEAATTAARECVDAGIAQLVAAGVPHEGVELDGEPVRWGANGDLEVGETFLRVLGSPLYVEWDSRVFTEN